MATPQMFNSQRAPQLADEHRMHLQFGLASLTLYAFAVLYPGFTILLALAGRLHIPLGWRRGAFVAASSLLLSPGPFLLTPFGPGALVPQRAPGRRQPCSR